jgi:2-polyprenyl-6-methoxyphenol hydroxylase-like FAD-dependent oxidoreductase
VLRDGDQHEGIDLAFGGGGHRIDFAKLLAASVQLYPQTDVFLDLANARARDGGDVRFGMTDVSIADITTDTPRLRFTDSDGTAHEITACIVVGADGSCSMCRHQFPETQRRQYFREYPFAWFGILCEAPPSAPELIYNHSEGGFALISQRTETLQRMYFQCSPDDDVDAWSDDRLAYSEILPDEKGPTCAAFLDRAIGYFAAHGITRIERLMTDNAWAYRWSLRELCAAAGIKQAFIRPHCPWQNARSSA